MGRVRGKGKKQTVVAGREDLGIGEEEKIPTFRKRGRPLKAVKDSEGNVTDKLEEIGEGDKDSVAAKDNKDTKNEAAAAENGGRKRRSLVKEKTDDSNEEEEESGGMGTMAVKAVGFRQNGNRRKNTPRRAAEVGVEC